MPRRPSYETIEAFVRSYINDRSIEVTVRETAGFANVLEIRLQTTSGLGRNAQRHGVAVTIDQVQLERDPAPALELITRLVEEARRNLLREIHAHQAQQFDASYQSETGLAPPWRPWPSAAQLALSQANQGQAQHVRAMDEVFGQGYMASQNAQEFNREEALRNLRPEGRHGPYGADHEGDPLLMPRYAADGSRLPGLVWRQPLDPSHAQQFNDVGILGEPVKVEARPWWDRLLSDDLLEVAA